ncbi:hypothetical protein VXS72_15610 [Acinetobacter pittii]|uniref:hypothetical protein n=1 Tax=Acinetobacter pittii TaxID=48296 RepID=UPI002E182E2F|nr:hypothetical protein [Acinetobacter pittii]
MAENESYGMRVEKKIDHMQQQMSEMNNVLIRLTERNEAYQSQAGANRRDIDSLQTEVNQAKGGLNFAKLISGTALAAIIGFGTWTVQSLANLQQRQSDSNQRIAIIESKLIRLDTDIAAITHAKKNEALNEQ